MKKHTVLIRTVMQPHTAGFKRDDVRKQKHLSKTLQQQRPAYRLRPEPQRRASGHRRRSAGATCSRLSSCQRYKTLTADSFLFISHIWNKNIRK